MRSTSALQEAVIPFMNVMLPKLLEILVTVARNPSKPHFNHYMFETLCLCIRILCKQNPASVEQFEAHLFPVFQGILQQDVSGKARLTCVYMLSTFYVMFIANLTYFSICRIHSVRVPSVSSYAGLSYQWDYGTVHGSFPVLTDTSTLGEKCKHHPTCQTAYRLL